MIRTKVIHTHLRAVMAEIHDAQENLSEELFRRLEAELKHSSLILAGDVGESTVNFSTVKVDGEQYGLLFTDMDEFAKAFPDFRVESHVHPFEVYADMLKTTTLDGFFINIATECFPLPAACIEDDDARKQNRYPLDNSYTSEELKHLKSQMDNSSLEEFIRNPENTARYEELFGLISKSTILTLRLSEENLDDKAVDGVISMEDEGEGHFYTDTVGGRYATVFTSEEKIKDIETPMNRYSQIVNFSQFSECALYGDMDGIVINPESDNILLTREILLEFSDMLERTCNDSRLNSAIFHMFLMEA